MRKLFQIHSSRLWWQWPVRYDQRFKATLYHKWEPYILRSAASGIFLLLQKSVLLESIPLKPLGNVLQSEEEKISWNFFNHLIEECTWWNVLVGYCNNKIVMNFSSVETECHQNVTIAWVESFLDAFFCKNEYTRFSAVSDLFLHKLKKLYILIASVYVAYFKSFHNLS